MKPVLQVLADGRPVSGAFFTALKSARIRDESGEVADLFEVDFDNAGGRIALPREGTVLSPSGGFEGRSIRAFGDFVVAGYTIGKNPGDGRYLTMTARPADLREDLKEPASEHFDETTLGDVVSTVAGRHGLTPAIDGTLAGITLPYLLRIDQSAIDFLARLGERFNAIVKVAAGRLVFVPRGGGTASGATLPPIVLRERDVVEWQIDGVPRQRFGSCVAKWHDTTTGKTVLERVTGAGEGPAQVLRTVYPTQAEAKAAAEAELTRLNRTSGSGSLLISVGRTAARAEADLMLLDFGEGATGTWRAIAVEHLFGPGGYQTAVEFEGTEDASSGSGSGFAEGFDGSEFIGKEV